MLKLTHKIGALLLGTLLLGCGFSMPSVAATFTADLVRRSTHEVYRFDDVVARLHSASDDAVREFSLSAIDVLIRAYESEVDLAADEHQKKEGDLDRWRRGTRQFVAYLVGVKTQILQGVPARVLQGETGEVRLVVGEHQVMLSAPRLGEQGMLEEAIASAACEVVLCAANDATPLAKRPQKPTREGDWIRDPASSPRFSSDDGLECMIGNSRHQKLKEAACLRLVEEVRALAQTVHALREHGRAIQWQYLKLVHVGAGKSQKLVYTADGGFVRVDLPTLLRTESVWREAVPWIKAITEGRVRQHVIRLPDSVAYQAS